jgi:hypothetical protein
MKTFGFDRLQNYFFVTEHGASAMYDSGEVDGESSGFAQQNVVFKFLGLVFV